MKDPRPHRDTFPAIPAHTDALFSLTKAIYKRLKPTSTPTSRTDEASWVEAHRQAKEELGL